MRFRQSERVRQTEPWGTVRAERSGSRLTERVASNGARLADITALFLPKSSQTRSVRHKSLRWGRRCGGGAVWGAAVAAAASDAMRESVRGGKAPRGRRQGATHRPARVRQSPDPSISTEVGAFCATQTLAVET